MLALLFAPFKFFSYKELVSADELAPLYIGIKPNFIKFQYMYVSWLNNGYVRGYVLFIICCKGWFFSLTPWVFNFVKTNWFVYCLALFWEALKEYLLLFPWCRDVFNICFETSTCPYWYCFSFPSCGWVLTLLSYLYQIFWPSDFL